MSIKTKNNNLIYKCSLLCEAIEDLENCFYRDSFEDKINVPVKLRRVTNYKDLLKEFINESVE